MSFAILVRAERAYHEAHAVLEDTKISDGAELRQELSTVLRVLRDEIRRRSIQSLRASREHRVVEGFNESESRETLERLQMRTGADPSFRQLDLPLS